MKSESEKFDDQTRRHFLCRLKSCCRFGTGRGKTCSCILLEQIRTIDKQRLKEYVCHIDSAMMQKVDKAIRISLEIAT